MLSNHELILRLILSAIIGGLIGMEREANNRPAGLRTHVLVTLGSSLIMLISTHGFSGLSQSGDPGRLAAQVVSGIGFLGAGTILRTGNDIRGLTTAASLWVCGGIGLAIGGGYYVGGITTAAIVLFSLMSLGVLEKRVFNKKYRILIVQCKERIGLVGDIGQVLGKHNIIIKNITIVRNFDEDDEGNDLLEYIDEMSIEHLVEIHLALKIPKNLKPKVLFQEIKNIRSVENGFWEDEKVSLSVKR